MPERSDQHPEPPSSDESLVEDMLFELLELGAEQRPAALRAMFARHPDQEAVLRRRLHLLEGLCPAAMHAVVGERFGRFELLQHLGGGTAEVYLASDPDQSAPVVLKILRHHHLLDAASQRSFAREALAASRLQHPCIARVLEVSQVDGTPYLVRPHVPGITLAEWIRQRQTRGLTLGAADVDLLLGWLEDILRALHVAHGHGIVHRDVKPANILLPYQGRPILLDFGLCEELQAATEGGADPPPVGTLAYMAPELLVPRERPVGAAADIYALGVTLFEATTLRLPFRGDSREALCRAILLQEAPEPRRIARGLPPGLGRVLAGALAKSAWDRYATAAAFADDLARLRQSERVRPPRRRSLQRLRQTMQRHRWWWRVAGAAVTLLCAALLFEQLAAAGKVPDLDLLSVPARLRAAELHADELVPGWPAQQAALARWLEQEGAPLAATLPRLRQRCQELATDADADPAVVESLLAAIAQLEPFSTDPNGVMACVQARLEWSRKVAALTVERPQAEWRATAAEVLADGRYGGLQLAPQLDLVPLGRDPDSGLFEFYHPRSAWPGAPEVVRDRATRRLLLHEGAGLVFVLIPPGSFVMGQQATAQDGPRYDPFASRFAKPHTVTLSPFFLSKFEMTQAQWLQLTGEAPAAHRVGQRCLDDPTIGYRHPVESVSANRCDAVLRAVGLVLPTEAQWEYACGAGQPTWWYFGDDLGQIGRHANVPDRCFRNSQSGDIEFVDVDDGYACTAPVGSYAANPFGLHDVIGNAAEWCRDCFHDYAKVAPAADDGLRAVPGDDGNRVLRGGSFRERPRVRGKTSSRQDDVPDRRDDYLGLRPARPVLGGGQ
jgi:formylglycine-generating enzyme required for sulfatase activity